MLTRDHAFLMSCRVYIYIYMCVCVCVCVCVCEHHILLGKPSKLARR